MNDTFHGTIHSRAVLARRIAAACGTGVLLLGAAACGSDDPKEAVSNAGSYPTTGDQAGGNPTQQQRPGANGKVAAVTGSTAQVQSQDSGQVAVSWTASTAFTKEVAASLADVGVGSCVMVTPASAGTGSETATPPTAVTAASVRITDKVDGTCSPFRGGGPGGAGPGGGSGAGPGGAPPAGGPAPDGDRPQIRGFGGAFGTVKAVSANSFVVTTAIPNAEDPTKTESTDVTVTLTGTTTYATTATGTAKDVKVGVCVNADGTTDDTGAVAATRIAVTQAVEGECAGGMLRFDRNGDDAGGTAS